MRKTIPFIDRLWAKIDSSNYNGCWPWTGGKSGKGYGIIFKHIDGKKAMVGAHRSVLELFEGAPPEANSQALHSCDNVVCCNPWHLTWGTPSQNCKEARDRIGRQGNQKLSKKQVDCIRNDPRIQRDIAEEYGVHKATIQRIKGGTGWLE